jgi:hypothetical protein
MPDEAQVDESHVRGAGLILRAFATARDAGKPEWRSMTTAVLKNRLLDLTHATFDEADWGATSIAEFVQQYPEIVSLDASTRPRTVRLLESVKPGDSTQPAPFVALGRRRRIRGDLWHAILDFSGDRVYVWDGDSAVAIPGQQRDGDDARPVLPTVTPEEFAEWRAQFVRSHEDVPEPIQASLDTWRERGLRTKWLPPKFRNAWTAEVKRRVLERLIAWFEQSGIAPPPNIVEVDEDDDRESVGVNALRSLVHCCVDAMSREELEQLALPAGVVARVKR